MKNVGVIISLVLVLGAGMYWLIKSDDSFSHEAVELEVYCAAGLRMPVEEIAANFEKEFGVKVKLAYGGSGELFGKLTVLGADLYIPADDYYTNQARKQNLVAEVIPFSNLTAGIMVKEGNPLNIESLRDLARNDVRVVLADKSAAVGKLTHKMLATAGLLEKITHGNYSTTPTVNAVANQVKLDAADAGIVWDSLMSQYPDHEFVRVAEFDATKKTSTVGVLRNSKDPTLALKFARYLSAKQKGGAVLKQYGFDVVAGDAWSESPTVTLFASPILRPVLHDLIELFQQREGCLVKVVYAECGEHVGSMRDKSVPDAFFPSDISCLAKVKDLCGKGSIVCSNPLVLLVKKGNPKGIHSLKDLSRPELKVGVAKDELRILTVLESAQWLNIQEDSLAQKLQTGALDAALLLSSSATKHENVLHRYERVTLKFSNAIAHPSYAVVNSSIYPQLMKRLGEFLANDTSREWFTIFGFSRKAKR